MRQTRLKPRNPESWVHVQSASWLHDPDTDTIVGYSRVSKKCPSPLPGANTVMRVYYANEYGYNIPTKY